MKPTIKIAIAGFGFSGLMTLRHLVMQEDVSYDIHAYDTRRLWAKGLAYATTDPDHLLNVRAARMGAFADNPGNFARWLTLHKEKWHKLHPSFIDKEYDGNSYVPRMIYGAYLDEILKATRDLAQQNGHQVTLHDGKIRSISHDLRFVTDTEEGNADKLILALGHYGARELPVAVEAQHHAALLHHPWEPEAARAFKLHYNSREWSADSHIVVLGTGLSAVDMLHSLNRMGYQGRVTTLSRHGCLPESHGESHIVDKENIASYPTTAKALIAHLQEGVQSHGENWRGYIDGLRPHTNAWWQKLPVTEKQLFLDHYLHWWSIHRHRMSGDSSRLIHQMLDERRLTILAGKLSHIHLRRGQFLLHLEESEPIVTDALLNASGYCYRLDAQRGSLINQMQEQGLIRPSALGTGIATDGHYRAGKDIYALGPLLFGERLETTAVAELREQAQELATVIQQDARYVPADVSEKPLIWSIPL